MDRDRTAKVRTGVSTGGSHDHQSGTQVVPEELLEVAVDEGWSERCCRQCVRVLPGDEAVRVLLDDPMEDGLLVQEDV